MGRIYIHTDLLSPSGRSVKVRDGDLLFFDFRIDHVFLLRGIEEIKLRFKYSSYVGENSLPIRNLNEGNARMIAILLASAVNMDLEKVDEVFNEKLIFKFRSKSKRKKKKRLKRRSRDFIAIME